MKMEFEVPQKIKKNTNKQNLENITRKTKILKNELYKEMQEYEITPLVAEKIFNGEEVIVCVSCGTPNMYKTFYTNDQNLNLYKCDKCKEMHFK